MHQLKLTIIDTAFSMLCKYEGRPIKKLQNDIILLIFKIWKFGNVRFVWNLIEHI